MTSRRSDHFASFLKGATSRAAEDNPARITIRQLLALLGQKWRGYEVVRRIEQALSAAGLRSEPPVTDGWIDTEIQLVLAPTDQSGDATEVEPAHETGLKVSSLDSANCKVVAVKRQDAIEAALALMQRHDFSQLAVMPPGKRDLEGAPRASVGQVASCEQAREDLGTARSARRLAA